jgi:hypothetical protein
MAMLLRLSFYDLFSFNANFLFFSSFENRCYPELQYYARHRYCLQRYLKTSKPTLTGHSDILTFCVFQRKNNLYLMSHHDKKQTKVLTSCAIDKRILIFSVYYFKRIFFYHPPFSLNIILAA